MISKKDKNIIIRFAKKYKVNSIYLFGSSLNKEEYNDIDLAVDRIKPEIFFKFYGELMRMLSKPADIVDLSKKSLFTQIIEKKWMKIV
ncbi:MAG: hypothetical protein GW779_04215 [Candidatus Altiarchaeum hamiconexum]|uniref:Polymerase beta nucleotidyltransferase domain-containing protein n=1 Tax=Candidatus Altarchaeum hamiconexum TaxID=1803513 RepID=A0A8J7YT59_9ARCH|nr:hypothetical protein [Candidatus Altarchaeum hamiconexum]OIQ05864.1 MAG: hypothetical protein AUK59_02185 [Candidatus Altarchaeum sp. CG2_30_32_3053]PIV27154.1 MAG: hypothetical protein COS36_06790 [Candidatus Altarchaeum sp. CG03_land_8_20_14_0_80_32_618]PIX49682.1 MAG: hypothetical protein COZ53_00020 [Candidatus Altarchaeum sp. CG_4_8_14_3_um_filter_33_2054]PIZ29225.1 MAG: hypothetical protein COY41_06425 [Candidatus Altarchaeum sp. CG_4_10_14_0_8_um_filter_32_851]